MPHRERRLLRNPRRLPACRRLRLARPAPARRPLLPPPLRPTAPRPPTRQAASQASPLPRPPPRTPRPRRLARLLRRTPLPCLLSKRSTPPPQTRCRVLVWQDWACQQREEIEGPFVFIHWTSFRSQRRKWSGVESQRGSSVAVIARRPSHPPPPHKMAPIAEAMSKNEQAQRKKQPQTDPQRNPPPFSPFHPPHPFISFGSMLHEAWIYKKSTNKQKEAPSIGGSHRLCTANERKIYLKKENT